MRRHLIMHSRRSKVTACRTLLPAVRVASTTANDDRDLPGGGGDELLPKVRQEFYASGAAQQAVLGYGTQHVYLTGRDRPPEPTVSIAAPFGQRDDDAPLRGREALLAAVVSPGPRVRVLHGLGGCG